MDPIIHVAILCKTSTELKISEKCIQGDIVDS